MYAQYRAGASAYTTMNPYNETWPGMGQPGAVFLISTALAESVDYLSSVTCSGASGTFSQLAKITVGNRANDMWIGYGFTGYGTTVAMSRSSSASYWGFVLHGIATSMAWGSAPTVTAASTASGTGTTATTNSLTPAVGDLLFASLLLSNTNDTTMSSTGHTFIYNKAASVATGNYRRTDSCWCLASAATSTTVSWTWSGTLDWGASLFAITPPAGELSEPTGLLVKGQLTATLDAAAEA